MKNKRILSMFLIFAIFESHLTHNLNAIHNSESAEQKKSLEKIFEDDLENSDDEEETEISENNPENLNDGSNILNQNLNSEPKTDNILSKFYNLILKHKIKSGVALLSIVPILYYFRNKRDNPNKKTNENNNSKNELEHIYGDIPFNAIVPILEWENYNCSFNAALYAMYSPEKKNLYEKISKMNTKEVIDFVQKKLPDLFNFEDERYLEKSCWNDKPVISKGGPKGTDFEFKTRKEFSAQMLIRLCKIFNQMEDFAIKNPNEKFPYLKGVGNDFRKRVLEETLTFGTQTSEKRSYKEDKDLNENCYLFRIPGKFTSIQEIWTNIKSMFGDEPFIFRSNIFLTDGPNIRGGDTYSYLVDRKYKTFDTMEDVIKFLIKENYDELPVAITYANDVYTHSVQIKYKYDENNNLVFSKFLFLDCHGAGHKLLDSSNEFLHKVIFRGNFPCQTATREEIENNKYYYMYDPNDPWKYIREYLQNRRS